MKKIVFSLLVIVMMFTGSYEIGFANVDESVKVKKEIIDIAEKYGLEVTSISKKDNLQRKSVETEKSKKEKRLKIKNMNEFETFLQGMKQSEPVSTIKIKVSELAIDQVNTYSVADNVYSDVHTVKWYAPYANGSLFAWKNITFNFQYTYDFHTNKFVFVDIPDKQVTSGVTGITGGISWNHDTGAGNVVGVNKDNAELIVEGHFVFGIDIGDFELGAIWGDRWVANCSFDEATN